MVQNAYLLPKIGADTAEHERSFAKNAAATDVAEKHFILLEQKRVHFSKLWGFRSKEI